MDMKQTAVQNFWNRIALKLSVEQINEFLFDFEQAQQMDKEQKQEFYNEGKDFSSYTYDEQYGGVEYWDREPLGFEDYYNKTYNK
jgi:hypothetical protein